MKLTVSRLLILMVVTTVLVIIRNDLATGISMQKPGFSVHDLRMAKADHATSIIQKWRAHREAQAALKPFIAIDYLLLLIVTAVVWGALVYLAHAAPFAFFSGTTNRSLWFLVIAFAAHAIQNALIVYYAMTHAPVSPVRWLQIIKYVTWGATAVPFAIALVTIAIRHPKLIFRYLSETLKSVWLFFPCILFILFFLAAFWSFGQGKDIIIAFTHNHAGALRFGDFQFTYSRLIFIIAAGFWIYVSWFFSRIISYIKVAKQNEPVVEIQTFIGTTPVIKTTGASYPELRESVLEFMPRLLGNTCFLALELAVLQLPVIPYPLSQGTALLALIEGSVIFFFLNRWIERKIRETSLSRASRIVNRLFAIAGGGLLFFVVIACFYAYIYVWTLFLMLLLFHAVFVLFINYRRIDVSRMIARGTQNISFRSSNTGSRTILQRVMDYLNVPPVEFGYFKWLLIVGFVGLIIDRLVLDSFGFARTIGPFSVILIGFGVLLAAGYIITAISVKYKVNFHVLFLITAMLFGVKETHNVNILQAKDTGNGYAKRPHLESYLRAWLTKWAPADTSMPIDMYFVMSNGGASRSGYWTASVLGKIEDTSLAMSGGTRFSDHLFCLSGTSGGGVGVSGFFSLLRDKEQKREKRYRESLQEYLKQDYFTSTFAHLLGPDYFHYLTFFFTSKDRATILEDDFKNTKTNDSLYQVPFKDNLASFSALNTDSSFRMPILFVNTTRMQDGNPGVVTNLMLDSSWFNSRIDVVSLLKDSQDISLATGAILGARFPYISPAGNIANNYFVDGGYFDNSGAGVIQEAIRGILNIGDAHATQKDSLWSRIRHIHFKVLHIINSPVMADSANVKPVPSITNDLLAPVLTIVGAYDMQTTVNDQRLKHFLEDIDHRSGDNRAEYEVISLYKDPAEWARDTLSSRYTEEPAYAMNWFISDTTVHRMNIRLDSISGRLARFAAQRN